MKLKNNKKGFSILVAIFMVGFLLILVIGVLNLMLRDMKDNRGSENYIKAYAGAEGSMELGLLKIKEKGYAINKKLAETNSGILSFNSSLKNNDPRISYKMNIATKNYTGIIGTGGTVIIPLFSESDYVKKPNFIIKTSGLEGDIIWNIIGDGEGMSGTGNFDQNTLKKYRQKSVSGDITYATESIENFLLRNNINYLMLFNKSTYDNIEYNLESTDGKFFSKPVGTIISSVQVGKFRQNITTDINNTEFLKMLKYSLYSK